MYRHTSTRYQQLSHGDRVQNIKYALKERGLQPIQNRSEDPTPLLSYLGWLRSFSNPVSYVWRETVTDLRQIRRQGIVDVAYSHVIPIFIMTSLLGVTIYLALVPPLTQYQHLCRPDGGTNIPTSFEDWKEYDPWQASEIFIINIGFGKLTFGQAKLIDVIWDTVFGRGGQAFLALVSYRVLTSAVSLSMEQGSVTLRTFEAIALDASAMSSIAKILRDIFKNRSARFRKLVPFVVLSSILILIFPTLASAMTGYSANFDAQISVPNGSTILSTFLQKVWYIIHDGSRLGLGFYDEYPVTDYNDNHELNIFYDLMYEPSAQQLEKSRSRWMPGCSSYAPGKVDKNNIISLQERSMSGPPECQLLWNTSHYTSTYGLLGSSNISSSFYNVFSQTNISLSPPALNITSVEWEYTFSSSLRPPDLTWSILPFSAPASSSYQSGVEDRLWLAYRNETDSWVMIDQEIYLETLKCHQQSPGSDTTIRYQWGFAFLPLILCSILLLVWTILIYAIHTHVRRNSQLVQQHRMIGLKRAVLDLAPIYQQHFDEDVSMCNETQIQQLVDRGHISFEELVRSHPVVTRSQRASEWPKPSDVLARCKSEMICLGLMLLITVMIPLGIYTPTFLAIYPTFTPLLFAGLTFMLVVGKEHFSRWLLFLPGLAVFLGLQTWFILRRIGYLS